MVDDLESIWSRVRADLSASVPRSTFDLWLAPLSLTAIAGDRAYISAPDTIRPWAERRYLALLEEAMRRHEPAIRRVALVPPTATEQPSPEVPVGGQPLSSHYTFGTFVVGGANRFAHAAALTVAEVPGQAYNPLFLYGPPGLGKTHLMGAIGSYLKLNAPGLRVLYTTAETFTRQFTGALHSGSPDRFKERFRAVDVLLIDDVQFLQGKPHTEEEFFHTFNSLHEAGSQLVLSADRSPHQLGSLADRLRNRFEWGLLAELTAPDPRTRLTLLRKLAAQHGLQDASAEILEALAARAGPSVRSLEGALIRLAAAASLTNEEPHGALLERSLPGAAPLHPDLPTHIRHTVAGALDLSPNGLAGPNRSQRVVHARHLAIYLTRRLTSLSLSDIGHLYGGRDHSTVHTAVQRAQQRIESDPATAALLDDLLASLPQGDANRAG